MAQVGRRVTTAAAKVKEKELVEQQAPLEAVEAEQRTGLFVTSAEAFSKMMTILRRKWAMEAELQDLKDTLRMYERAQRCNHDGP